VDQKIILTVQCAMVDLLLGDQKSAVKAKLTQGTRHSHARKQVAAGATASDGDKRFL
jgi:hypothetical protein